jgi:uncharacterized membrane protein YecN with MAPEG domain
MHRSRTLALLVFALALVSAGPGWGSERIEVPGYAVTVRYEARHARVARRVAAVAADALPRLTRELGVDALEPIEMLVVDDLGPYRRALQGELPEWGVAFAVLRQRIIVVDVERATRAYGSLDEVIPHELSHLLLMQQTGGVAFPVWFIEGLAQWQAGEWNMVDAWQLMNAVWGGEVPPLRHLLDQYPDNEEHARNAYRLSYAAFTDLFERRVDALPAFVADARARGSFPEAFVAFTGVPLGQWMADFDERLGRRYHSRLLVFQTGPLFSIAAVLFLFVILRYQLRKRNRLKALERSEGGGFLDEG